MKCKGWSNGSAFVVLNAVAIKNQKWNADDTDNTNLPAGRQIFTDYLL
jgi:hypothetical protein